MGRYIKFLLIATAISLYAYVPLNAYAKDFNSISEGICRAVQNAQSGPVKALMVIIVLFMGVGAFFGKVNWGLVVQVIVGIAGALGAAAIAEIVTGGKCDEESTAIHGTDSWAKPH